MTILKALLRQLARRAGLLDRIEEIERRVNASQATQVLLGLQYRELVENGRLMPSLSDVEFRVNSQNGEDGILLYLFSLLESPTKTCVELCAGNGVECNTANLIVNHGWRGLLVDGDKANIARARQYYSLPRQTLWYTPTIVETWVTAENVNVLLAEHGFSGAIDLLSLDMDGIDYWVWKALDHVRPRVVVAEFNWCWGPEESKTVPYDPKFHAAIWTPAGPNLYIGASLAALTKLAREKGYRLVGCQRSGFNAFFVQNGLGEELLPEVSPTQCFEILSLRLGWSPALLEKLRAHEWATV